jgi:antibiotic biosynthesis monooxygenase (ABM) superfamily enzyme
MEMHRSKQERAMTSALESGQNASAVITHRVKDQHKDGYEKWLNEIVPLCKTYPGHQGVMVIRPVPGATTTFTVVIEFDTCDHLLAWLRSSDRKRMIEKVQPLLIDDDRFFVRSGLDFWFTPEGAKAALPTRWKQFLVTWSAIYPLVLVTFPAVESVIHQLVIPDNRYLRTLVVTCIVVLMMVYVVMPRYTKLVHRWLFS